MVLVLLFVILDWVLLAAEHLEGIIEIYDDYSDLMYRLTSVQNIEL